MCLSYMDVIWRISKRLSSALAPSSPDSIELATVPATMPISREKRTALLKRCMRYPSPYKVELTRCLAEIAPDTEMMRDAGYCTTDLLDLQLGWPELQKIGFTESDLYELGLTYEMTQPESIYAPLLNIPRQRLEMREEQNEEEDSAYYL